VLRWQGFFGVCESMDPIRALLDRGVITPTQVDECRSICARPDDPEALLGSLVARGFVDREELSALGLLAEPTGTAAGATQELGLPRPGRDGPRSDGAAGKPRARLGRFDLLEELGRGGMGMVYKAWDTELRRHVALKGMLGTVAGFDEPQAARFRHEARAVARLRHPGIIAVHEVGEVDGQAFLVMDLIEGTTLGAHLADRGRPPHEAARLVRDVAEAIAYAHREGVLHRDLKPDNILIDAAGKAYVTDFGLARDVTDVASTRLTVSGAVLGTPSYMAPEQAEGRRSDIGPRTDVWGLGAVLYEGLAGAPPFEGASMPEVVYRVVHADPTPPSRANPTVPRELEAICLRCLEKEPRRRYAGAAELAQDLGRWLAGEPVLARPATALDRAWRWSRRRKPLAAALAGLALAVGAAGWWAMEATRARYGATLTRAEDDFLRRTEGALRDALMRRRLGDPAYLRKVTTDTIREADEHLGRHAESAAARFLRGWALRLAERPEDAVRDLGLCLERAPAHVGALFQRGLAHAALVRAAIERARRAWRTGRPAQDRFPGGAAREPGDAELTALEPKLAAYRRAVEDDFRTLEGLARADRAADLTPAMVRAGLGLLALFRGQADEADRLLREALDLDPLCDEAWEGLMASVDARQRAGAASLEQVRKAYDRALEVLRGHGPMHLGRADIVRALANDAWFGGRAAAAEPLFEAACADCRSAARLDPERAEAWAMLVDVLLDRADAAFEEGKPADGFVKEAHAAAEKARGLAPSAAADVAAGKVLRAAAQEDARTGRDPRPALRRAVTELARAVGRDPALPEAHNMSGHVQQALGEAEQRAGEDARPAFRAAIDAYTQALQADAYFAPLYLTNRGNARTDLARARATAGEDPRADLDAAAADHREAVRVDANHVRGHINLAVSLEALAGAFAARGEDPIDAYREGLSALDQAIRLNPEMALAYANRASLRTGLAGFLQATGRDATAELRLAADDCAEATKRNPNSAEAWGTQGNVQLGLAEAQAAAGGDPRDALRVALEGYARLLEIEPGSHPGALNRGIALRRLGDAEARRGGDPAPHWRAAIAGYDAVLRADADSVEARVGRGAVYQSLAARAVARPDECRAYLEKALEDFSHAARVNPGLWQAFANQGMALESLGRPAEAVAAYERAQALVGDNYPPLTGMLDRARASAEAEKGK